MALLAPTLALLLLVVSPAQDPLLQEAQSLLREGRVASTKEALTRFESYHARYPDDRRGTFGVANALIRLRRPTEAAPLLRQLHAEAPDDEKVLFNLASCLHNQRVYDEAIVAWRKLRDLADVKPSLAGRPEWARFWGQAASELGLTPEALEAYQRCVRLAPTNTEYRAALAHELLESSRFEEALVELKRVVESEPQNARYRYQLGWSYLKTGADEAALKELNRAVELDPNLLDAHLKLGTLYARQQKHGDAVVAYRTALSVNSLSVEALHALSRILNLTGDAGGAREAKQRYEEVRELTDKRTDVLRTHVNRVASDPGDLEAYEEVARFYLEEGDADSAEPWLLRLLWRDPDNALGLLNLSTILARRGDFDGAMLEVEKLLRAEPDNVPANLHAGRVLCSQRRWKEALPLLERALEGAGEQRPQVEVLIQAARREARSSR